MKRSAPRATKGLETSGAIAYGTIVPRCIVNCAAPVNWRSVLTGRAPGRALTPRTQRQEASFRPRHGIGPSGWSCLDSERDWALRSTGIAPYTRGRSTGTVPAYTRGQTAKSILRAWAGVINSHMSMPALRRLWEDAGESPPECGQKIILFSKGLTRRNLYIESGTVFLKGEGSPPKGDSDGPIEDKFEREPDLAPGEAERPKSDEGLGDHRRNCLWDYSPKTHRELRRAGELEERLDRKGAERLRRGPNGKRRVSAPGTALGHQCGAAGLGTGLGMDCAAQERSPRTRGDRPQKASCGPGRRHQLAYEDACVAAVAGGRWRESARVWTENNSFFKRAYATESIYREWDRFSKGER